MTHVGVTTKCHWWVLLDENWGDDRKSIIEYFTNSKFSMDVLQLSEIGSLYKYIGC